MLAVVVAGGGAHAHNAEAEGHSHSHSHSHSGEEAPVAKHAHSIQDLSVGLAVLCEWCHGLGGELTFTLSLGG